MENPHGAKTFQEASAEALEYIDKRRKGEIVSYKTCWNKLNEELIGGFEERTISLFAGMSGSGKTLLMNQLVNSILQLNPQDFVVSSFNFEMISRNLIIRDLSSHTKKSMKEMLSASGVITDKDMEDMDRHLKEQKKDFLFFDMPRTPAKMVETIDWVANKYKKSILMPLDHTILVKKAASHAGTTEMLYNLGETLTDLKKTYPITMFIASQLNREIENIERKRNPSLQYPNKSDISYSDSLYQHADLVLITHIPYMLNISPYYGVDKLSTNKDDMYWHILKNRVNEPQKILKMKANFKHMKIEEV